MMSSRLARSRCAAAALVQASQDKWRDRRAADALLRRLGQGLLDQRLDVVEARLGGRASASAPLAPSSQCACAIAAASAADSTRTETGGPPAAA